MWTQLKCFVDSGYTCNKRLVVAITTFKMMGVVMRYYLCLWPVNSGENTGWKGWYEVVTSISYILLVGMQQPTYITASFQPIQLLAQEEGATVT